jgi:hypothetical protein
MNSWYSGCSIVESFHQMKWNLDPCPVQGPNLELVEWKMEYNVYICRYQLLELC